MYKKHFCLYIYHYKLKVKSRPLLFLQTYKLLTKTRFVTCVRNIATQVIAMSNALHSSNQTVFVVLSLLLIIKHTKKSFWKLTNRFDDLMVFFSTMSRGSCGKSSLYIPSELLTQWNEGCKTLNKGHYVYTFYQRLSVFHVLFLYDWLQFPLALAISFQGNFHIWREDTFIWTKLLLYITFWNLVLTIVG